MTTNRSMKKYALANTCFASFSLLMAFNVSYMNALSTPRKSAPPTPQSASAAAKLTKSVPMPNSIIAMTDATTPSSMAVFRPMRSANAPEGIRHTAITIE
jgi:hypothetical protein